MAYVDRSEYVHDICSTRRFDLRKERDQDALLKLADKLLEGNRGDDIMLHENTYDPHTKQVREIPIDLSGGGDYDAVETYSGEKFLVMNYSDTEEPPSDYLGLLALQRW